MVCTGDGSGRTVSGAHGPVSRYTDRGCHCPVPVNGTCVWAGLAPPPTLMFSEAELVVAVVGLNVVLIVQLAPAASVAGKGRNPPAEQVLVCAKRFGFVPPIAMLVIVSGTVDVFVTVTTCGGLVVLIAWFAKLTDAGETVYVGRITVPVSGMVCETAGAATLTVSVWFLVVGVIEVGRNVTFTEHVAPTAIGVPITQLFVCANCPRLVPPRLIPVIVSGAVPTLARVMTCAAVV